MSFAGHVLCQRMLMGVAWPFAIIGKPIAAPAAAPVAALRNFRRGAIAERDSGAAGSVGLRDMDSSKRMALMHLARDGCCYGPCARAGRRALSRKAACRVLPELAYTARVTL